MADVMKNLHDTFNFLGKSVFMILILFLCPVTKSLADSATRLNKEPVFVKKQGVQYKFDELLKTYFWNISHNWLMTVPSRNPGMLDMFADREKKPHENLLPWSGEFAGKYLTGAVEVLDATNNEGMKRYLQGFVNQLISLQAENGYLGPWPKEYELSGKAPNSSPANTWDAWNHYHTMMGLLLWYEETGDERALKSAQKIGDLFCNKFLNRSDGIYQMGSWEMNLAPVHSLCLLYEETGKEQYIDLAKQIIETDIPKTGKYVEAALSGKEFYQFPLPRWESLHPIMGLAEAYYITGNKDYRKAFEHIWWSIVKLDRHNTGGFSSGEKAVGNPYSNEPIETCATVAWTAMSVEMLRLTGNSIVADELELTLWNATLGSLSRSGKWSTYNTPMNGKRKPSTEEISFQIRPGSEELNCCSVNASRGLGMITDWALMQEGSSIILNWYGDSEFSTQINDNDLTIRQKTDYPKSGIIDLEVITSKEVEFELKLRIPYWSERTLIKVNDRLDSAVSPGRYFSVSKNWKDGDKIRITLDMSLRYLAGEKEQEGKYSIYRGPILLAYRMPGLLQFSTNWKEFYPLHCCRDIGTSLKFNFEGDSITWIGRKYDDAGKAEVKIDGKVVEIVSQYGPERDAPFSWKYTGLGLNSHTIELKIIGKENLSKDSWINIERFETQLPVFDAMKMNINSISNSYSIIKLNCTDNKDTTRVLQDFDSAGEQGQEYITWLQVLNVSKVGFSISNPTSVK